MSLAQLSGRFARSTRHFPCLVGSLGKLYYSAGPNGPNNAASSVSTLAPGHGHRDAPSPATLDSQDSYRPLHPPRPLSPHLTIYQPQLTWLMSIGHRLSGAGLASLVYAFGIGYACSADMFGTMNLVQWTAESVPDSIFLLTKFTVSLPFFYHTFNGIRHLVWDVGVGLSLKAVYAGGWLVNAGSLVCSALLAIFV